ncbi:MAG: glutamine synthetase family protein [Promethearchaeota archaeon]
MVNSLKELEDKIQEYEANGTKMIKFGISTIDGVLTGKYISLEKFKKVAASTGNYCDVVLGWDVMDRCYDSTKLFTGWHTGFPDGKIALDLNSERLLKEENNLPFFLGNFLANDGKRLHPVCPRALLKRVIAKAKEMGYSLKTGYEYEFFVFNETPKSVREKGYQNLDYLTRDSFGYSIVRASVLSELFNSFVDYFTGLQVPLESVHCETGPGAWEAAIKYGDMLESADRAMIFKTFSKVFFEKRDLMATFMAKSSMQEMGAGCHVHESLFDTTTGKPLFYDESDPNGMSKTMKQFLAGQLKYLKPFLAMCAPTINSYARLVKGAWAPIYPTWGIDNRTVAIRVVPGGEKSMHLEYRVPGADINPYLVGAVLIASGMLGIQQELELGEETKGNAYQCEGVFTDEQRFPSNLKDSYRNLAKSQEAKEWFGEAFVNHFVITREWEVHNYEREINDWQMKRYFEII